MIENKMKLFLQVALFSFFLSLTTACAQPRIDQAQVDIRGHRFFVEIARSSAEWQQGLMFRESIATNAGMFFYGTEEKMLSFWMKNTPISLDILFISKDLKLVHLVKEATPLSEQKLSSVVPALHVLEILGGQASALGLEVGDVVTLSYL